MVFIVTRLDKIEWDKQIGKKDGTDRRRQRPWPGWGNDLCPSEPVKVESLGACVDISGVEGEEGTKGKTVSTVETGKGVDLGELTACRVRPRGFGQHDRTP